MNDWKRTLREFRKTLQSQIQDKQAPENTLEAKAGHRGKPDTRGIGKKDVLARPVDRQTTHGKGRTSRPIQPAPAQPRAAQLATTMAPEQKQKSAPPKISPPKPKGVPEALDTANRMKLTRHSYYMTPESWVSSGAQTQYSQVTGGGTMDIVIGLDFGTSYTKAAVGMRDQIFPVSWEGLSAGPDKHLLPSEYSELGDGNCQIGQAPAVPVERVHQKLKQPLINPAVSSACIAEASVFVALALRYIRAWVYQTHGGKIGTSQIRWLLNLGAPSNGLETGRLEAAYTKLGRMAWELSLSGGVISLADAYDLAAKQDGNSLPKDLFEVSVLPEFVAQIAGYVQSSQRRRGLHGLVDVGGGTLDVVTFIVHQRDDEDVFPFLVPEIRALGTQMLYQNRLVDAPTHDARMLPDELAPVLEPDEFAKACGLPKEHILERDGILWNAVRDTVAGVFYKTRQRRYRKAEAWTDGFPLFLTGGGGKVDGYATSVKMGGGRHARSVNLMPLPPHPRLANFDGGTDGYQRVSVACGLAQDSFAIGRLVPARDVEDDEAPRGSTIERPDRDELYPH
ncbi:MAG: hypothetical protein AB1720_03295 [Pseudomonadota bacterium]